MNKIELAEKIDRLKKENDTANKYLQGLEQEKSRVITECLIRNGRILELEERISEEG
jgi:hypothetical protein